MRGDVRSLAWVALLTAGLIGAGIPTGAVAAGGGPLADAGLDQTVTRGATVYLDGRGSTAPDGEITAYRWRITTPDGATAAPADPTAARTEFVARRTGTYEVTLEVTDDEGRRATDTLYVEVNPPAPPSVTLDGPETATAVGTESYTARVDPGDNPVETIVWSVDGTELARESLAGTRATRTVDLPTSGTVDVAATVIDTAGERDTARLEVTVAALPPDPGAERTPDQPAGTDEQQDAPASTDGTPTEPDSPADPIRPIEEPELGEPGSEPAGGFVEPEVGSPKNNIGTQSSEDSWVVAYTSTGALAEGVFRLAETGISTYDRIERPNTNQNPLWEINKQIGDSIVDTVSQIDTGVSESKNKSSLLSNTWSGPSPDERGVTDVTQDELHNTSNSGSSGRSGSTTTGGNSSPIRQI